VSEVGMGAKGGIRAAVLITEMLPGCRVLFLSAHASMSEVSEAVPNKFVFSFTSKPLRPLDLLSAIGYMLPRSEGYNVTTSTPTWAQG
jgi:DNA-binding NtrC family response regulator